MRNLVWLFGGACMAAAALLVSKGAGRPAVPELAHRLEEAWSDHHTVA